MIRAVSRIPLHFTAAAGGTLMLLAGQVFRFPSPIEDALNGTLLREYHLSYPLTYTLFAPFHALADLLTFNTPHQHIMWGLYLLLGYWLVFFFKRDFSGGAPRALKGYAAYLSAVLLFLLWGALYPRPSARLEMPSAEHLALDFHSHTTASHDGRKVFPAFTPLRNNAWHAQQGYGAGFITDHNNIHGSLEGSLLSKESKGPQRYFSFPGEELSLHDAHVVVLGNEERIEVSEFTAGLDGIHALLNESETRWDALTVMSLPEYWEHHWENLENFASHGLDGIELVNSAPKPMAFPLSKKEEIIRFARKHNIFICGVSDSHGWGSATFNWSVMHIPGLQTMNHAQAKTAVLKTLKQKGFHAVSIATRLKHTPTTPFGLVLSPFLGAGILLRSLPPSQAVSCLFWLWLIAFLWRYRLKRDKTQA